MTALDQILIGIEKLPISDFRKNEYMINLMYVHTDEGWYSNNLGLNRESGSKDYDDLMNSFIFSATIKGSRYWYTLYQKLVKNNWK